MADKKMFDIKASGRGVLERGHVVGAIEARSLNEAQIALAKMVPDASFFDLEQSHDS